MAEIDYQALFGSEDYDPCAVLVALRPVLIELQTEGTVAKIKFRDRDVEFHKQDLGKLENLVTQMESECRQKSGRGPKRYAVTAGYRKR